MLASTVACPQCQAPLRSAKPIPPGARVKCPKCAASFTVPGEAAPPAAAPPEQAIMRPDVNGPAAVAAGPPPAVPVSAPLPDVAAPRRGKALPVLLGLGALAGVGVLAVWWLFMRGPTNEEKQQPATPTRTLPSGPLIELTAAEKAKVKEMTKKGVEFLKNAQVKANGNWGDIPGLGYGVGCTAMAALTLLECGVKPSDPSIRHATYYLRNVAPGLTKTYELSLAVLYFNKLNDPLDKELVQMLALRLVAGQHPSGGWGYNCGALSAQEHYELLKVLRELQGMSRERLLKTRPQVLAALPQSMRNVPVLLDLAGMMREKDAKPRDFFQGKGDVATEPTDNSNTQFALLALWAARKHDLPLRPTLELVARRFRDGQNVKGNWIYNKVSDKEPADFVAEAAKRPNMPAPTMTCAGLLGMALGYGLKEEKGDRQPPSSDEHIQKALNLVGKYIKQVRTISAANKKKGDPDVALEMYFLWSVERVGVLFHQKEIGGERWYHWGLARLEAEQSPADGSWNLKVGAGATPVTDTCFALLFLQQVNLAADLTDKLRELEMLAGRQEATAGKE
jgi:hypothetical protein